MNYSNQTQHLDEVELLDDVILENKLVIHNDDVNTFEWVIETLVEICKHTMEQAEQCSFLIHYKGKYAVKRGTFTVLKPMKDAITDRGINATIE
jgi:ATP-dependent Clp protease adaptor protein ClpS